MKQGKTRKMEMKSSGLVWLLPLMIQQEKYMQNVL